MKIMQNRKTVEVHVGINRYLDEVVENLCLGLFGVSFCGKSHISIEVNEHKFCTDELNELEIEDTVYNTVVGMSRSDYLETIEEKNRIADLKIDRYNRPFIENKEYEEAVRYGKRRIYPQLHDEWENFVTIYYFEQNNPKVVEGVMWLMGIFEFGVSVEEAELLYWRKMFYSDEAHIVPLCFLNFHEKGPDLFEKIYKSKINSFYVEVVREKRARNFKFQKETEKYNEEKSKQFVAEFQKNLIKKQKK